MNKEVIETTAAPAPIGPYSQAIIMGKMIFVSGQIACITFLQLIMIQFYGRKAELQDLIILP